MIDLLRDLLEENEGEVKIGYARVDGQEAFATLAAVDEIGIAVDTDAGLVCVPWSSVGHVRILEAPAA